MSDLDYLRVSGPISPILVFFGGDCILATREIPNVQRDRDFKVLNPVYLGHSTYEVFVYGKNLKGSEIQTVAKRLVDVNGIPISEAGPNDRCLTRDKQYINITALVKALTVLSNTRVDGKLTACIRAVGAKVRLKRSFFFIHVRARNLYNYYKQLS